MSLEAPVNYFAGTSIYLLSTYRGFQNSFMTITTSDSREPINYPVRERAVFRTPGSAYPVRAFSYASELRDEKCRRKEAGGPKCVLLKINTFSKHKNGSRCNKEHRILHEWVMRKEIWLLQCDDIQKSHQL